MKITRPMINFYHVQYTQCVPLIPAAYSCTNEKDINSGNEIAFFPPFVFNSAMLMLTHSCFYGFFSYLQPYRSALPLPAGKRPYPEFPFISDDSSI